MYLFLVKMWFDNLNHFLDRLKFVYKNRIPKMKMKNENSYKCRLQYHKGKVRLHPDDEDNLRAVEEVNSDLSDVESSAEDNLEDQSMSVDDDFSEPQSILTDDRLSEEFYSDENSLNSTEFETEIENTSSKESLVSRMDMWEDVINGQIDRTNRKKII